MRRRKTYQVPIATLSIVGYFILQTYFFANATFTSLPFILATDGISRVFGVISFLVAAPLLVRTCIHELRIIRKARWRASSFVWRHSDYEAMRSEIQMERYDFCHIDVDVFDHRIVQRADKFTSTTSSSLPLLMTRYVLAAKPEWKRRQKMYIPSGNYKRVFPDLHRSILLKSYGNYALSILPSILLLSILHTFHTTTTWFVAWCVLVVITAVSIIHGAKTTYRNVLICGDIVETSARRKKTIYATASSIVDVNEKPFLPENIVGFYDRFTEKASSANSPIPLCIEESVNTLRDLFDNGECAARFHASVKDNHSMLDSLIMDDVSEGDTPVFGRQAYSSVFEYGRENLLLVGLAPHSDRPKNVPFRIHVTPYAGYMIAPERNDIMEILSVPCTKEKLRKYIPYVMFNDNVLDYHIRCGRILSIKADTATEMINQFSGYALRSRCDVAHITPSSEMTALQCHHSDGDTDMIVVASHIAEVMHYSDEYLADIPTAMAVIKDRHPDLDHEDLIADMLYYIRTILASRYGYLSPIDEEKAVQCVTYQAPQS